MVNYGYYCSGWSKSQKEELAKSLQPLCDANPDKYNMHPYIEVDEAYEGVRIRRITHLPNNDNMEFEKKADVIYLELKKKFNK